ncbi:hypothetical protein WDJ51_06220 [Rathayibacter sp. YIM 133350]|uniref:hypothetical protein n=1 Tax=Rathayibacter sp. YIM 133350 TaxID=3131992 RepID=UPI00307D6F7F
MSQAPPPPSNRRDILGPGAGNPWVIVLSGLVFVVVGLFSTGWIAWVTAAAGGAYVLFGLYGWLRRRRSLDAPTAPPRAPRSVALVAAGLAVVFIGVGVYGAIGGAVQGYGPILVGALLLVTAFVGDRGTAPDPDADLSHPDA